MSKCNKCEAEVAEEGQTCETCAEGFIPSELVARRGLPKLLQPSKWSCLPTSLAMVMSHPFSAMDNLRKIMTYLGRDDERGFHIQELLGYAFLHGFVFTPLEMKPELEPLACGTCENGKVSMVALDVLPYADLVYSPTVLMACIRCNGTGFREQPPMVYWRVEAALKDYDGVLVGRRKGREKFHAVAWCSVSQMCLDPEEGIYGVERFDIETFWACIRRY